MSAIKKKQALIIGGGAAGYFAAIRCAELQPAAKIVLVEASEQPLRKVRISGGGRCNVTHNCFEPRELIRAYPRGGRELLGAFNRFQPRDTVAWFTARGIRVKAEADGRMFPATNRSETITNCLEQSAANAGVDVRLQSRVQDIRKVSDARGRFLVEFRGGRQEYFHSILLATGSARIGYELASRLGHSIEPLVPSLFTFNINDPRLHGLSGLSVANANLDLYIDGKLIERQQGPALITHWGLSGPAVLKISAWAARALASANYQAELRVNWTPQYNEEQLFHKLWEIKRPHPKRQVRSLLRIDVPRRYWERTIDWLAFPDGITWSQVSKQQLRQIAAELTGARFQVQGKSTYKDEFVTCGGVNLREVDFRNMQSKLVPGLYFAGEVLDVDGITGGFNFQNAWTTGYIAGTNLCPA